jgi:putative endonuclease
MKQYYVYLMTNPHHTVIYTGVTSDLSRRVTQHKEKIVKGFTAKYNAIKLVYYEIFHDPYNAISREKQIKAGSRIKKIKLIESVNPGWKDLSDEL